MKPNFSFTYSIFSSLIISLTLLVLSCSKVQMSAAESSNSTAGIEEPPAAGLVREECAKGVHKSSTKSFDFAKPSYTCEWEKNGNLQRRNRFLQARIEDEKAFDLEPGAIICDAKFSFAEQEFLYDDHFLLTFDNSVIASSYDFSHVLPIQYGMLKYDWSKIAGIEWVDEREGIFCGENGNCSWPETDTKGEINLNYSDDFMKQLMAADLGRTRHLLNFISVGDNDDRDCEHSDVNFDLTVDYVVVK